MLEKFFTRIYSFVLALLFISLVIFFNVMIDSSSVLAAMTFQLLLITLAIVIFFNLLRVFLSRDRGSYRSMILEKPLFNPKGRPENVSFKYPLFPRFIAVYFDKEGEDPYNDEIVSIQAVRYENGYLTDGLFLPIKKSKERKRRKLLYFEDAYRYLKTYTKDFPIIIDNKDYANTYLRENLNSMMLIDSTDAQSISKMIYPGLDEYGIEEIYDYLRLEAGEDDSIYGAKVVAAIYLDYLRLNGYYTDTTWNPFAKRNALDPKYPAESTIPEENRKDMTMAMNLWEEDEKLYKVENFHNEDSSEENDDGYIYEPIKVNNSEEILKDEVTEDTTVVQPIIENNENYDNENYDDENYDLDDDVKVYESTEEIVPVLDAANKKYTRSSKFEAIPKRKKGEKLVFSKHLKGKNNPKNNAI